jgi:hypothetical protein
MSGFEESYVIEIKCNSLKHFLKQLVNQITVFDLTNHSLSLLAGGKL